MLAGLFDPKYRLTFTSESVNEPARNVALRRVRMATTLVRTATATTLTMAMMSSAAKEDSAGVRGALPTDV
jgi:hypothetical protein